MSNLARKKLKAGKTLKRELVRAVMERSQSFNIQKQFMAAENRQDPVYDDIEETLNIPYINREEIPLAMDVFRPKTEEDKELPVIVTIHGGGLTMGDRTLSRPFSRYLAHKGYIVFSVEYRLAPRANVCEQLSDVCAGMDLIGEMLVDYNIDFTRIFLAAESAGAFLATYVAAMHDSDKLQKQIGYKPSRMNFKAIGLMSGMLYTNGKGSMNKILADQIYGDKRDDEEFLQYMNPEHPEIINNLPPVYLTTSRGDMLNNYSFMMHEALKKAGKVSHFQYYGDDNLAHSFSTLQLNLKQGAESVDDMVEWFEKQAQKQIERNKPSAEVLKKREAVRERTEDGSIENQKVWQFVKEHNMVEDGQLDKLAVIDAGRKITYGEMFDEWEQYARVFSALDITSSNKSRAAVCGVIASEPLFAFYALNMVGVAVSMFSYPDFLPMGSWKTMIEKEKITDLIISDTMVSPQLWREIEKEKEALGLKNVILIHSKVGGACTGPGELIYNEFNRQALKRLGAVFMEDLVKEYESVPIRYSRTKGDHQALIAHTSGTAKGTRKPLFHTDKAVNSMSRPERMKATVYYKYLPAGKQTRYCMPFDFSSMMCMGVTNAVLTSGNTLVLTFFGFLHPRFVKALDYYDVNFTVIPAFMMDKWLDRKDLDDLNLSSLKVLGFAGSYIPPEKMKQYEAFLRNHGYENPVVNSYGMSEAGGGADSILKFNDNTDTLGRPDDPESFRIKDENDGKIYTLDDGERTGILYMKASDEGNNKLDDEEFFELTEIDGKNFVCTNDLVRLNADGTLSYAGRADRYFVNNEGVRFDPGLVEVQMSRQAGIKMCAIVPFIDKRIHDTVPALYVVPAGKAAEKENAEMVRQALIEVFVKGDVFEKTNLPVQFVVCDSIPCNINGKIDVFRITRERPDGISYNINPVLEEGKLADIEIERNEEYNGVTAGTLPHGMGHGSAFNVFDIFNAGSDKMKPIHLNDPMEVLKAFCPVSIEINEELKEKFKSKFNMSDMTSPLVKKGTRFAGKFADMKNLEYDFIDDTEEE